MTGIKRLISGITACSLLFSVSWNGAFHNNAVNAAEAKYNYAEALQKSLYFYEAQQAGPLPEWNRVSWRGDSTMSDDVTGGWYDAGDHVKFNLPMAYSASMLAWGLYQYSDGIKAAGQYEIYRNNLEFVLDYLVDCDRGSEVVYQVGDGEQDHKWWGPVELVELEMGKRPSYTCNASCVTGEMSAALAAGAAALKDSDKCEEYKKYAEHYFDIAWETKSDDSYTKAKGFYDSWSGFWDELFWASNWLYIATGDKDYLKKAKECIPNLGKEDQSSELKYSWGMCWDDVMQGAMLLYAINTDDKEYKEHVAKHMDYWSKTDGVNGKSVQRAPGGLAWLDSWGSLRYATTAGFLAAVASDTIFSGDKAKVKQYTEFYETQINYALGDNPDKRSYVVGFGNNPPEHPHHRTSHGAWDDMKNDGVKDHRHVLYGALVGGPSLDGSYTDDIENYMCNEVADDYNAGYTALLCKMSGEYKCKPLSDFPPEEKPDGPEFYVTASLNQQSDSFTEVKILSVNHSAWPARVITDLSLNYYFDLSEVFKAGLSVNDVTVRIGYDEWSEAKVSEPIQYKDNIYYVKVSYPDGSVLAPIGKEQESAELQMRISVPDQNKVWDASNDYSAEGLKTGNQDIEIAEHITMYDGDRLIWGTEPDGTKADGVVNFVPVKAKEKSDGNTSSEKDEEDFDDGAGHTVVIENDWDGDDEISTEAETDDDKSTEYTPDENNTPESADRDEVNTRIFGAAVIAAVIIGLVIAVIISVKRKKRNGQ